ncbi:MAG: M28 family peptidase [Phycisphaerales bacterium]|jgi:hypothetical protein|nr:M28 family peptidase [Phycisphaerales bacterium]
MRPRTVSIAAVLLLAGVSTRSMALQPSPEPPPPATPPKADITSDTLLAHIRALPTKRAPGPDRAHADGLLATQQHLITTLTAMGYTPTTQIVRYRGGLARRDETFKPEWVNIIIEIPGRGRGAANTNEPPKADDPVARQVLLVTAHFDAVPNSPGADDDGSGVAALLEMARVLRDRPMQRTVRFVLFNLEEVGLVGSRQYAALKQPEWTAPPEKTTAERLVGMMTLEMLGYFSTQPGSQQSPFRGMQGLPDRDTGDFVALAGSSLHRTFIRALEKAMQQAEPTLELMVIDHFPNAALPIMPPDLLRSDHQPFITLGLPGVMVTDTANFRNPHYHKPTDTVDTLHPELFQRTARALTGAVHTLAGPLDGPALAPLIDLPTRAVMPETPEGAKTGTGGATPAEQPSTPGGK